MSTHTHISLIDTRGTRAARRGFSLLELLAVMSIMALLSTLAVTSYFSAVRGMANRSARRNFENSLVLARQRACIDGTRVSLIAFNEVAAYDTDGKTVKDMAASYVVCKEIGRLSLVSGIYLFDEFSDLEQLFGKNTSADSSSSTYRGGTRLYNLDVGSWTLVKPYVVEGNEGTQVQLLYSDVSYQFKSYAFEMMSGTGTKSTGTGTREWKAGDAYGVEVAPVQALPKGFTFGELSDTDLTDVQHVTFEPDGTATEAKTFTLKGSKAEGGESHSFTISKQGKITY